MNKIIEIVLDNTMLVKNMPFQMVVDIKKHLTLPNPKYYDMIRRGHKFTKEPKCYFYYKKVDNSSDLILPRGFIGEFIRNFIIKAGYQYTLNDKRVYPERDTQYSFNGSMRPYQEKIINDIDKKEIGIIKASTGSGKSVLAAYLSVKHKTKCLIITTQSGLVQDFLNTFANFLGVDKKDIGIIQGGKREIKDITIASVQTLRKLKFEEISDKFGLVIFDELHEYLCKTREPLFYTFRSKYQYGLTATPTRNDGKTLAIGFLGGAILSEYNATMLTPTVYTYPSMFRYPFTDDYNDMINELVENEPRNKLIISSAEKHSGIKLILCMRKEHCEKLAEMIGTKAVVLTGDKPKKLQEEIKNIFRGEDCPYEYLIGTSALLSTGVDIPKLNVIVMTGGIKVENKTLQSVGRILRLAEGKTNPIIVEIRDALQPQLNSQWKKRIAHYQNAGFHFSE